MEALPSSDESFTLTFNWPPTFQMYEKMDHDRDRDTSQQFEHTRFLYQWWGLLHLYIRSRGDLWGFSAWDRIDEMFRSHVQNDCGRLLGTPNTPHLEYKVGSYARMRHKNTRSNSSFSFFLNERIRQFWEVVEVDEVEVATLIIWEGVCVCVCVVY